MASKPLEKSAWDDTEVIDALSDGDADGLPDDTPMDPMDPQTMMALMRDMEKKMAAMRRQLESTERSAGLVEPRNIHRPLRPKRLAKLPRERTLMSPRHEDAKDSIASPTRTITALDTSPNSVAGMEAQ